MEFFGLELKVPGDVYLPREDSFLLAEVLEDEIQAGERVLDLGTGSGLLSLVAARRAEKVVGVDINKGAVNAARENSTRNGFENTCFFKSDLFEEISGEFDLVVFNPPYLPAGEENKKELQGSEQWLGGEEGTEVIKEFSKSVSDYLSKGGRILMAISSHTGLGETTEILNEEGLEVEVLKKRKISWETLYVIRSEPSG